MSKRKSYLCPKCKKEHLVTSKIGKTHKQYLPVIKKANVKTRYIASPRVHPNKIIPLPTPLLVTKKGFHVLTGFLIILLVSFFTLVGVYFYEQTVFNELDAQELLTGQIKSRSAESKYLLANFENETQISNPETTSPELDWETATNNFSLLNDLKTELNTDELSSVAISNSGEYASWVSGNAGKYLVYLLKKGVQSLSDKVLLGEINSAEQTPTLTFTPDDTYLTTADGQQIFALASGLMLLDAPLEDQTHQAYFAPDYTKILIITHTSLAENEEIIQLTVRDLATGITQEIFSSTGNKETQPELTEIMASWSPDSAALVFNYNKQLWLINAEGTQKRQLTSVAKNYQTPEWSKDGKYITYLADETLYKITLRIKDLLSTKVVKVVALGK